MMEFESIPGTPLKVSRIAIGTWAIGGWLWGGTDEAESIGPKFQEPRFGQYLAAVQRLDRLAQERFGKRSFTWPSALCLTKVLPRRCGARAIRTSCKPWTA
jgi:hypothetical protein